MTYSYLYIYFYEIIEIYNDLKNDRMKETLKEAWETFGRASSPNMTTQRNRAKQANIIGNI